MRILGIIIGIFTIIATVKGTAQTCGQYPPGQNVNRGKLFDVQRIRANFGTSGRSDFKCPSDFPDVKGNFNLSYRYYDNKVGYNEEIAPYQQFIQRLISLSSEAIRSKAGGSQIADCAVDWFHYLATRDGGVMSRISSKVDSSLYYQSQYQRVFFVQTLLMNMLAVKDLASPASASQIAEVKKYFGNLVGQIKSFEQNYIASSSRNNIYYSAGFSYLAYGILANDRSYRDLGRAVFFKGIQHITGSNDSRGAGILPLEYNRKDLGFTYHIRALRSLIFMAELAATWGDLKLYDTKNSAGSSLHTLVGRVAKAFVDFKSFAVSQTQASSSTPDYHLNVYTSALDWMEVYYSRFGNSRQPVQFQDILRRARAKATVGGAKALKDNAFSFGANPTIAWGVKCL